MLAEECERKGQVKAGPQPPLSICGLADVTLWDEKDWKRNEDRVFGLGQLCMNEVEEMRLEDGQDQIVARSEHQPKELSTYFDGDEKWHLESAGLGKLV